MDKKVELQFSKKAKEAIEFLQIAVEEKKKQQKPTCKQLLKSLHENFKKIQSNPYYGDLIPKKYLNKKIINEYGTNSIYRVELIGYWRLLYTLRGNEIIIVAIILDFMDHKDYDKLFKYRKK